MTTTPLRIVSVVPSQTELLHDLGLETEVIGITRFCIHPAGWFKTKIRVGGTKQLKIELIKSLQPTIVLANKEENVKDQIEAIEQFCPVYCSDISTLQDALHMIKEIARLTDTDTRGNQLIETIRTEFASLTTGTVVYKTAYLIWKSPYMAAGGDTFIDNMMQYAGFSNVFHSQKRYPPVTVKDLIETNVEVILLSSEPFPFKEKQIDELKKEWMQLTTAPFPTCKIVDGEMFSWYGSRLIHSANYFRKLRESLFLNHEPDY